MDLNLAKYEAAKTKLEKSLIVVSILDAIREGSNNMGGFVKLDPITNCWFEVGDEVAREKIGQLFRLTLAKQNKAQRSNSSGNSKSKSQRQSKSKRAKAVAVKKARKSKSSTINASASENIVTSHQPMCTSKRIEPDTPHSNDAFTLIQSQNVSKKFSVFPASIDDIDNCLDFDLEYDDENLLELLMTPLAAGA